jgi:hypothetical protein
MTKMAECDTETLQKLLLDILEQNGVYFGIPLIIAKKQLLSKAEDAKMDCSQKDINDAIQRAVDNWVVDKVLAPIQVTKKEELGLDSKGPFWHLKKLSSEERDKYDSLLPVERALIGLLREQDEPGKRGRIPVKEAEEILSEQGFDEIPEGIWVEDIVEETYQYEGDERVDWYFLVQEHLKTDEYKKHEEQMLNQGLEKQRRHMEIVKDLEEESEQEGNGN